MERNTAKNTPRPPIAKTDMIKDASNISNMALTPRLLTFSLPSLPRRQAHLAFAAGGQCKGKRGGFLVFLPHPPSPCKGEETSNVTTQLFIITLRDARCYTERSPAKPMNARASMPAMRSVMGTP